MKRTLTVLMAACLLYVAQSCSKDKDSNNFSNTPEATAENDAKSGGVYKGVIIGSTGTLKITMQNNVLSAEVTIDGVTKVLPCTNLPNWTSGTAIDGAIFQKDNWTITFYVDSDGSYPEVEVSIPGHEGAVATVIKERSTLQVKAFEGTYKLNANLPIASGTWNFVAYGDTLAGIRRENSDTAFVVPMFGTLYDGNVVIQSEEAHATGKITGDNASGVWVTEELSGVWSGKRTL